MNIAHTIVSAISISLLAKVFNVSFTNLDVLLIAFLCVLFEELLG